MPIRRALLSVFDKTGVVELAKALHGRGVELLSTGGTFKALKEAGIPVTEVSAHTNFPEMMDGRVKTPCTRRSTAACWACAATPTTARQPPPTAHPA